MKSLRIVLVLLAIAMGGAYLWLQNAGPSLEKQPIVISHGTADIGGPFELVDTKGNIVTDDSLHGQYVLVYFGYTNCPDVCPIDMNRMSMTLGMLEDDVSLTGKIQPIFISVDPARDTPEVIGQFLSQYHESFIGLTGTQAQIEELADYYKVYIEEILSSEHADEHASYQDMTNWFHTASFVQAHETSTGLINHTSYFYLMDPDGAYVTHFGSDLPPTQLAAILKNYLEDM